METTAITFGVRQVLAMASSASHERKNLINLHNIISLERSNTDVVWLTLPCLRLSCSDIPKEQVHMRYKGRSRPAIDIVHVGAVWTVVNTRLTNVSGLCVGIPDRHRLSEAPFLRAIPSASFFLCLAVCHGANV